jgi:hypothetical protein
MNNCSSLNNSSAVDHRHSTANSSGVHMNGSNQGMSNHHQQQLPREQCEQLPQQHRNSSTLHHSNGRLASPEPVSDLQGSDSTGPEDGETSRRLADRAARNRESSRRAREKAKGRLKSLEAEVLVLRDHCRRYKMQMDALAQQAARGQCGVCGCVLPPSAHGALGQAPHAHGHAHISHAAQAFLQPPQDQNISLMNAARR